MLMDHAFIPAEEQLVIRYPVLWLAAIALVLYLPSVWYGVTGLDDFIFIYKLQEYNSHPAHVFTTFRQAFGPWNSYYRPVLFDSILLNYLVCGTNVAGFHLANVLLHPVAVMLMFQLMVQLRVRQLHAFILAMLFAVHPVLSQAVAWIPGRNDMLLAIFTLSYFLCALQFEAGGKRWQYFASIGCLLLALFTKETAVFAPLALLVLLLMVLRAKWNTARMAMQYLAWVLCYVLFFTAKTRVQRAPIYFAPGVLLRTFASRLPLINQYIGKIFIPINLSVFPNQQDTVHYLGAISVVVLGAICLAAARRGRLRPLVAGGAIFLIFLFPALFINQGLISRQTFEHRLYLPMTGMLLLLSPTVLFRNRLKDAQLLFIYCSVALCFVCLNLRHQIHFRDANSFWEQAVATSPSSAQAYRSLADQLTDTRRALALLDTATKINPGELYLNFSKGMVLQRAGAIAESAPYLLAEKNATKYYECDFYLSRVAMAGRDTAAAIQLFQRYILRNPFYSKEKKDELLRNPAWKTNTAGLQFIVTLQQPKLHCYFEN